MKLKNVSGFSLVILFILSLVTSAAMAVNVGRQHLKGHRNSKMAAAPFVGEVPSEKKFNLSIALPLRNADQLETFLKQVSDPSSPLFRHYLTTEQFTEAYGPTESDYQSVVNYLKSKGLQVTALHANRMLVSVTANKDDIQNAFHVGIHNYQRPDGTTFYGPDDEPSLDLDTPVLRVGGLDNFVLPHPKMVISTSLPVSKVVNGPATSKWVTSYAGSGPSGLLMGKDFRNAYVPGVTLTGSGQSVALFELDTYYPGDVQRYMTGAGLTNSITNVYLDGWSASTTPGGGNGEVSLDIDQAMSMAPGSSEICYMGPNIDDVLNRIATDNLCKQISSSWGWGPSSSTELQIEQQYSAQGQTYFNASGDSGSFTSDPGGNEDDPLQVLVGGTDLNMNGSGASYSSETGWAGTTGGILTSLALPAYQTLIPMNNGASTTNRNCPDVSAVASGCVLYANNSSSLIDVGGTSVAAPTWAGFMALVNQQAVGAGKPTVGFANPALYAIAQANYTANFHDITSGSAGTYSAAPGYDLVTGIGSPNGQTLINSLSNAAGAPTATPTGTPTPIVASTWRIRSGISSSYTDCQNNVWSPDENFTGGNTNGNSNSITGALPCSTDGALYQNERYGNFSYVVHVPTGSYQVTLKFAEIFDGSAGQRIENISINGQQLLSNFDIFATAGGQNIAVDKVFSNIASSNGAITITIAPTSSSPDQNAKIDDVQIIPQPPTPTFTATSTFTATPTWTVPPCSTGGIFGNTAAGTGGYNLAGQLDCAKYVLAQAMTVTSMDVYMGAGTAGNAVLGIYSDNGGAVGSLLAQSNAQVLTTGWNYFVVRPTILPAGNYWLSGSFGGAAVFDYSATGGGSMNFETYTYTGQLPTTLGSTTGYGWLMSIYASGCSLPTATFTPTFTNTVTSTPTASATSTYTSSPTSTSTATRTNTATATVTNTYTATFTPTATNTWSPTLTSTATSTFTSTATSTNSFTPVFTSTNTNSPTASWTPTVTSTLTASATPTLTGTSTFTFTFTSTATPTNSPTASWTPTVTSTNSATSTFTSTATPTNSFTSTFTPTFTSTLTNTNTATSTATNTFTATSTNTATSTATNTFTATSTNTATKTNTPVPPTATFTFTATSTPTFTFTATKTNTPVPTSMFTFTPTSTNTKAPTATFTFTFSPTRTNTPVPPTATPTSSSACSGVAAWNGNFVAYPTGALVTYNNELYSCIQAHTSEPNWMPSVVPALWKDMGPCSSGTTQPVATGSSCTDVAAWSGNSVGYSVGTKVTYNNELYQCLQAHTSQVGWTPVAVPALWKDLGSCSNIVTASNTVLQSAVAGPNISKGFEPVHFFIQLKQTAQVTVSIFTPMGQLVAHTSFFGNAGMNNWLWDVQNTAKSMVSSGLYVYNVQVTSEGSTETKMGKIVIVH